MARDGHTGRSDPAAEENLMWNYISWNIIGPIQRLVSRFDTTEWVVIFVAVVLIGYFALRGTPAAQSR
jgi:hypothetical protein